MTTPTKGSEGPDKISPIEQRRRVMRQAEQILEMNAPSAYDFTIRTLIEELALLDGLYELLRGDNRKLKEELQRVKDIVGEDLPHWYLTHRLYSLVYPQHLIDEMLGNGHEPA